MNNNFIDLFKIFKVLQLKEVQKKGSVKIIHQKILGRKVVSIQGTVSASNYIKFPITKPKILLNQRYLYMQCMSEPGLIFSFLIHIHVNSKIYKLSFSTLNKSLKLVNNQLNIPLQMVANKWTILVIDMHEISEEMISINEIRLSFELAQIQLRATMRIKGIFLSDKFFNVEDIPKQMAFNLVKDQIFYDKFRYFYVTRNGKQNQNQNLIHPKHSKSLNKTEQVIKQDINKQKQQKKKQKLLSIQKTQKNSKDRSQNKQQKKINHNDKILKIPKPKNKIPIKQQTNTSIVPTPRSRTNRTHQDLEVPLPQPKPQITLDCQLLFHHGASITIGNISTLESYLITPQFIPVHKKIVLVYELPQNIVILAYQDGTMAYINTIRKQSIRYFQTGLQIIQKIKVDNNGILAIVGSDFMKRQVIMLIKDESILFRQISNYHIKGLLFIQNKDFKEGMITFGFQNIRIWKIKKQIITGTCIYLGQYSRKTNFNDGLMKNKDISYLVNSKGNLTTISLSKSQIQQVQVLEEISIDFIRKLSQSSFITANEQGLIKIYSNNFTVILEIPLMHRVKQMSIMTASEVILTHYNKTVGRLLINEGKYQFIIRSHYSKIIDLRYHKRYKRLVSISQDHTIRIWRIAINKLQQQYQFQIHEQQMGSLAIFEKQMTFLVGFESGIIRKFDMKQFKIVEQKSYHEKKVTQIQISKGDQYILTGDISGKVYLLDSKLQILSQYEVLPQQNIKLGFNKKSQSFFISKSPTQLVIYSLKTLQPLKTLYLQIIIAKVLFDGELLHIIGQNNTHHIYKNNRFQRMYQIQQYDCLCLDFPLSILSIKNKFKLKVLGDHYVQEIQSCEPMDGMVFSQDEQSLLFSWGKNSFSIYCWRIKTRNLPKFEQIQIEQLQQQSEKKIVYQQKQTTNNFTQQLKQLGPINLKPLYPQYEEFFPTEKPRLPQINQQEQNQFLPKEPQKNQNNQNITGCNKLIPLLYFGHSITSNLSHSIWNSNQRYIINSSFNQLMINYLKNPISQKFYNLPFKPQNLRSCEKYFSFTNGNCITIYNSLTLKHYKTIVFEGNKILDYNYSNCQNYIIIFVDFKNRSVISVVDINSTKIITSSYLKNILNGNIFINQFKNSLEFFLLTASQIIFYRITSIQTLQLQELQLNHLTPKTGSFLTAYYTKLQHHELILIGTTNGSLIVIDSRSATLLVLCSSIIKSPIFEIRFFSNNSLCLISNSINLYLWEDIQSLGQLVEKVGQKQPVILTFDSPISIINEINKQLQLILTTKLGIEWLVDIQDKLTIKLKSIHTKTINSIDFINESTIITGSADSSIKITNIDTLQQITEYFKPKKIVNCVRWIQKLHMIVANHGNYIGFYSNDKILGSCEMDKEVICIQKIPQTNNLLIGTLNQIVMIYILEQQIFRIQILKITTIPDLFTIEVHPKQYFDIWMCTTKSGKINVWSRKCIKRIFNPIQELANISQLEYYLIDNYIQKGAKPSSSIAKFTSPHSYLCLSNQNGKLQERNYREHLILREIQLFPSVCFEIYEDKLIVANLSGDLCVIDKNSMIIEKIKVLEQGIVGIKILNNCIYAFSDRLIKCIIN